MRIARDSGIYISPFHNMYATGIRLFVISDTLYTGVIVWAERRDRSMCAE